MYRDERGFLGKILLSFITGGVVGAAIALLYAPQSGERTREEIREKAERTIIKTHKIEEEIRGLVNRLIGGIKTRIACLVEEGKEIAEDKKKEIIAAIEAGKRVLDEQRGKLQKDV